MTALDPLVHAPTSFICGAGPCMQGYAEKPERVIAGQLLEDTGDWLAALRPLERRRVPDGVAAAIAAANEAVTGWVEWLDRTEAPR